MAPVGAVDDETIEALVRGDEVAGRFAALAGAAREIRRAAERYRPAPSPRLRSLLAGRPGPPGPPGRPGRRYRWGGGR